MTNEVISAEDQQLEKVIQYFQRKDIIPFLVKNTGFYKEEISRRALEFVIKVNNQDMEKASEKDYKPLAQCDGISKQQAFLTILSLNLPSDIRSFYYLYNNKGRMKFEISYKGMIYIAERFGFRITANLVFEGDFFKAHRSSEGDSYEHEDSEDPFADQKKIKGCYVYVEHKDYKPKLFTYSYAELEKSKQKSKAANSPAWRDFANDMFLKCGLRKCLSIILAKTQISIPAAELFDDEMQEASAPAPVASQKTADFASQQEDETPVIDYDMATAEQIDEDFKQQQFAELQAQFDYRSENHDL